MYSPDGTIAEQDRSIVAALEPDEPRLRRFNHSRVLDTGAGGNASGKQLKSRLHNKCKIVIQQQRIAEIISAFGRPACRANRRRA